MRWLSIHACGFAAPKWWVRVDQGAFSQARKMFILTNTSLFSLPRPLLLLLQALLSRLTQR